MTPKKGLQKLYKDETLDEQTRKEVEKDPCLLVLMFMAAFGDRICCEEGDSQNSHAVE